MEVREGFLHKASPLFFPFTSSFLVIKMLVIYSGMYLLCSVGRNRSFLGCFFILPLEGYGKSSSGGHSLNPPYLNLKRTN